MQIRRLAPTDSAPYRALRLRGLRDHPEAFTSSVEEENQRPLEETRARLSGTSAAQLWGAFEPGTAGDELIGVFGFVREERLKNRHKATLVGLLVAPGFTGRGVGRALVEAVLLGARAEGIALLVLTVTEGNAAARVLYARAGFQTFGIEPDAIRVDELDGARRVSYRKEHMALQLTPPLHCFVPASHLLRPGSFRLFPASSGHPVPPTALLKSAPP